MNPAEMSASVSCSAPKPATGQLQCPGCLTTLTYTTIQAPIGPCPACGTYIGPSPPPAPFLPTPAPPPREVESPPLPSAYRPGRPSPQVWKPSVDGSRTARRAQFRRRLQRGTAKLGDLSERTAVHALGAMVLVAMVMLCVLLFMKLDAKRTAQALGAKDPPIPAVAAPEAGLPTPGPDRPVRVPGLSVAPEPTAFDLATDTRGGTVEIEHTRVRPDELTIEDLRSNR